MRIVCNDGFNFSVNENASGYCSPRYSKGPYTAVELGYPSAVEPLLKGYHESKYDYKKERNYSFEESAKDTVYAYVPANLVMQIIRKHKGIKEGRLPPLIGEKK